MKPAKQSSQVSCERGVVSAPLNPDVIHMKVVRDMHFPSEKLLIKLWDTIADKGIANLLKPWQIRREGSASTDVKSDEIIRIAEAENIADRIRRGELELPRLNGSFQILSQSNPGATKLPLQLTLSQPEKLQQEISQFDMAEAIRKEVNVVRSLLHAEKELESDESVPSPDPVDSDWLYRWRDIAGQISNDELQSLWGTVLAGEVKMPGSCSLRTLDFLRNLSQTEAKEIELISKFVTGEFIFKGTGEHLKNGGVTFALLLRMQNLGVLSGVDSLGLNFTLGSNDPAKFSNNLRSHSRVLVCSSENPSINIELPMYQLTEVGRQVVKLGKYDAQIEYLKSVGLQIKSQGASVTLAQVSDVGDGQFVFFSGEVL
jgi:Protein of unknown function (DUF2806)